MDILSLSETITEAMEILAAEAEAIIEMVGSRDHPATPGLQQPASGGEGETQPETASSNPPPAPDSSHSAQTASQDTPASEGAGETSMDVDSQGSGELGRCDRIYCYQVREVSGQW